MQLQVSVAGKASGKAIDVSDKTFGRDFNEGLVHQVVTAYLAKQRAGTKAQKTRSEVRGGGAKPWRQKGTGRARAGTIRSPIWRSGGVTFAAKPRSYEQKVNKKMYRSAMTSILSELVRQQRLVLTDDLQLDAPKTKELAQKLAALSLDNVCIVYANNNDNLILAARNLPKVGVCAAACIDPVSLIAYDKVLMSVDALKHIEEKLS